MNNIEQQLTEFKLQLSKEWLMLQKHKWRRPKYMNIPRSLWDDPRCIKLSPEAAKALITILLIAGENLDNSLPNPEMLYFRLRATGQCFYRSKFLALIDELNRCGFILKTTPELQSYRVTDKKEREELSQSVDNCGKEASLDASLSLAQQNNQEAWRGSEVDRLKMGDKIYLLQQRLRLNDLSARLEAVKPKAVPRELGTEAG
jgi:hypothetical protein